MPCYCNWDGDYHLVYESYDVLIKEQMVAVLRCIDGKGCVIVHFFGIRHVTSTMAELLKAS